jgi:hypothetical protein
MLWHFQILPDNRILPQIRSGSGIASPGSSPDGALSVLLEPFIGT